MVSSALGTKRHCQNCGGNFYDLKKDPIICPSCNTRFDPEELLKSRRSKPAPAAQPKPEKVEKEDAGTDGNLDVSLDVNIDDADTDLKEDTEVIEDGSDLVIASSEDDDEDEAAAVKEIPIEGSLDAVDSDDDSDDEDEGDSEGDDEE